MASSGSRRKFRRSRFSRPMARKKLIWTTASGSVTEVAGVTTGIFLCLPSQWQVNTSSGDLENAKILRCILTMNVVALATAELRTFSLSVDDLVEQAHDPRAAASYSLYEPFHVGQFHSPGNTAASGGTVPLFNGFKDNVRDYKVNRKIRSDAALDLYISPAAAAGNQLTFTYLARVLVQLD